MSLQNLGWNSRLAEDLEFLADATLHPARVIQQQKETYTVHTGEREFRAHLSGKFRHNIITNVAYPAVGDWVAVHLPEGADQAVIQAVLPRKSVFLRKEAGLSSAGQIIAANADTAFLATGLDGDFNPRRIERYLTLAWESGTRPVILLTKADLRADLDSALGEIENIAVGVPVHAVSATAGLGMESLAPYLRAGETVVLLGSSGVGKSTLLNAWLGREMQRVQTVREDDSRGRHTTTSRQLFVLPGGAWVLDTPGMRELGLWDAEAGLKSAFEDVLSLAEACRFRDCRHESEPGCAVRTAVEEGRLSEGRLGSYQKLVREEAHAKRRHDVQAQLDEKRRWKGISKLQKEISKRKPGS